MMATELQQFIAMLVRAEIGHGTRIDYHPAGTGVQVEHDDGTITDWFFDDQGLLTEVLVCE